MNPLAAGNLGPRPSQVGLGVFSDLLGAIGMGFRANTANNQAMHASEPQGGSGMLGDFMHGAEVAFNP